MVNEVKYSKQEVEKLIKDFELEVLVKQRSEEEWDEKELLEKSRKLAKICEPPGTEVPGIY